MNPLSFKEFLWANGVEERVISIIKECYETKSVVNEAMNFKLLEYFKQYIVVGGMPNVVNTFINNHNYEEVLNLQKNILIDYKNDIAKYAVSTEKLKQELALKVYQRNLQKRIKSLCIALLIKTAKVKNMKGV